MRSVYAARSRRRGWRASYSFVFVACTVAFFLSFVPRSTHAQTTVKTRHASVTFSGDIDLNFIYRSDAFFTVTKGEGRSGTGPSGLGTTPFIDSFTDNTGKLGATPKSGSSEFYLDPNVSLRFDIDVGDDVTGVVELRTPFADGVRITEAALLAVKASRYPGQELRWDKSQLAFTNHEEATQTIVKRNYRDGFAPPSVG